MTELLELWIALVAGLGLLDIRSSWRELRETDAAPLPIARVVRR